MAVAKNEKSNQAVAKKVSDISSPTIVKQMDMEKEKTKRIVIIIVAIVAMVFLMCGCCGLISVVSSAMNNGYDDDYNYDYSTPDDDWSYDDTDW